VNKLKQNEKALTDEKNGLKSKHTQMQGEI
jgi:hypothetical protein